jgi:hypothetical protein
MIPDLSLSSIPTSIPYVLFPFLPIAPSRYPFKKVNVNIASIPHILGQPFPNVFPVPFLAQFIQIQMPLPFGNDSNEQCGKIELLGESFSK